jgi:FkbM family methyltransferase
MTTQEKYLTTGELQYRDGVVRLPLERGASLDVTPQECWGLVEKVRRYLIDNCGRFEPRPVKVIQKNQKCFSVIITRQIDFWRSVESDRWEPETFKIFDDLLSADCTYLDVGSWIGPTVLYAAQLAKRAYAFEPDPVAYQELAANVHANEHSEWASRLTIYNKAVAPRNGRMKLGSRGSGGDSMSSSLLADENTSWEVESITLRHFVEAEQLQQDKLFVKMDIEGSEYEVLPSLKRELRRYRVVLFLSIHPHLLMARLAQDARNSIGGRIRRRLLFVWYHLKLVRSLPFRYFYDSSGKPVSPYMGVLKALLHGGFAREIVATNERWNGDRCQ